MHVQRIGFADEYLEEGRSVVLFDDGRVLSLAEPVTTVLQQVGDEVVPLEDLVSALVQTAGAPGVTDPAAYWGDIVRFAVENNLLGGDAFKR